MEEDLGILKLEYLSNHLLNPTQILNLSLDEQTTLSIVQILYMKMTSNGRWPPMEDDLNILKVEYLTNRLLDHTQILNLTL